ncbi:MAG: FumA C-terminus/TtdB family hydratase beta subunit [Proteobacteria bacterium]|nr:FumA C-terminus/TtdB family hydratase beta subunit [Pseudomonadota bacterium]MBU1714613.1 FumA C-terminus/TtdB family hydratase beta subunit [Pseudomonadota bacterium]
MSFLKRAPSFGENFREVKIPFEEGVMETLQAGDLINLTGTMYTGRDQTHRRLCALLAEGKTLPVDLDGQLLYYVGPTPAQPGQVIGAAGPTTSYRMDPYTPQLLALGLKATLGKGARTKPVKDAMQKHGAIYLATIGGAGAFLSKSITSAHLVAFEDAGPEALFRFEVNKFPAVVINDLAGKDYYQMVAEGRQVKI